MSYSFRLPEEDPVCECRYDEVHDRMDRDDCPFHCDMVDDPEPADDFLVVRKPPARQYQMPVSPHPEARIVKRRSWPRYARSPVHTDDATPDSAHNPTAQAER